MLPPWVDRSSVIPRGTVIFQSGIPILVGAFPVIVTLSRSQVSWTVTCRLDTCTSTESVPVVLTSKLPAGARSSSLPLGEIWHLAWRLSGANESTASIDNKQIRSLISAYLPSASTPVPSDGHRYCRHFV